MAYILTSDARDGGKGYWLSQKKIALDVYSKCATAVDYLRPPLIYYLFPIPYIVQYKVM